MFVSNLESPALKNDSPKTIPSRHALTQIINVCFTLRTASPANDSLGLDSPSGGGGGDSVGGWGGVGVR